MPLLNVHVMEGRGEERLTRILDVAHSVVLDAFGAPERDRYQILHEHAPNRWIVQDTGLGLERTDDVVLIEVTSRPRARGQKEEFYRLLTERLQAQCDIAPADVMVTVVENSDEDWSFGLGRAQFLTGDL